MCVCVCVCARLREPVPVRGYMYMRGLGLMSALSSFYLIFTGVVSFFFGVKDSLDSNMESSSGLRPSWAYILTVRNNILCTIQYTLSYHPIHYRIILYTVWYTIISFHTLYTYGRLYHIIPYTIRVSYHSVLYTVHYHRHRSFFCGVVHVRALLTLSHNYALGVLCVV